MKKQKKRILGIIDSFNDAYWELGGDSFLFHLVCFPIFLISFFFLHIILMPLMIIEVITDLFGN